MLKPDEVYVSPEADGFRVVAAGGGQCVVPRADLVGCEPVRMAAAASANIRVPGYLASAEAVTGLWDAYGRLVRIGRPGGGNCWFGDWFPASEAAVLPYRIANLLSSRRLQEAGELASTHPLASPLCYLLGGLDPVRFAAYLTEIRDPRWFAKPDRLDDSSRLAAWFGVFMRNVEAVLGYGKPGYNFERFRRLVRLDGPAYAHDDLRSTAFECDPPLRTAIAREVLRLARRTIRLTHLVWLAELSGHPEMAFDPARFFDAEEVAGYATSPCGMAGK